MTGSRIERFVDVPTDVGSVWPLLVLASRATTWWGLLEDDIGSVAQQLIVHTGATSHYRIWIESIAVDRALEFTSAYLGVGPVSSVRIALARRPTGAVRVLVSEELTAADPATIHQAGELWQHRPDRLAAAALSGVPDSGGDIVVRRSLDSTGWRPLHVSVLRDWLPLSGTDSPPRWFYIVDSDGPRRFPITRWRVHYDDTVAIGIEIVPGTPATEAEISVTAHATTVELTVRHTGWSTLALDAETLEVLRDRFTATWRHAVQRAAG